MDKKILVINPFGIGDVLFSTPLLRSLKKFFPKSRIAYLCNKRVAPLLEKNPSIDKIFVFEKDEWRDLWRRSRFDFIKKFLLFLKQIRKEKFDVAVDLSLSRQYNFFLWLIGVPQRIGFDYKDRGYFLTNKIKIDGYHHKHIAAYYLELCCFLEAKPELFNLQVFLTDEEINHAQNILMNKGIRPERDLVIGIVPGGGASWGRDASLKHWDYEKFASLAEDLVKMYNAKIILFGDAKEKTICQKIWDTMRNKPLNLAGETDLREFAAILKLCRLVICNDGGPLHIAIALGVNTVSIFGPVNEKVYGPFPVSSRHLVVTADVGCRPCYWRFRMPKCGRRICLEKIEPQQLMRAVEMLL